MSLSDFTSRIPPLLEEVRGSSSKDSIAAAIERAYLRGDIDGVVDLVLLATDARAWMRARAVRGDG